MQWLIVLLAAVLLSPGAGPAGDAGNRKDAAMAEKRNEMVDTQIARRGIKNPRVLQALRDVERHRFVPKHAENHAYQDSPLVIGHGQTISQPYIVALMTELLELQAGDTVLEIGTGSGYQAAVLSLLVDRVYSIEIVRPLGEQAAARLSELGYDNVEVRIGDGYAGWPEHAPFDAIIVTAAPPEIPQALVDQLADNGRMVVPVGDTVQELVLLEKKDGKLEKRDVAAVRFVPMVHGRDAPLRPENE